MLGEIFRILAKYPGYRVWITGGLFSQIGTGFTQIAIFAELGRLGVGAEGLGTAFALSLIPGIFSSQLGKILTRRVPPSRILISTEILGALSVGFPWAGSVLDLPALLFIGQFLSALWAGISVSPAMGLISQKFNNDELPAVSSLQSIMFSSQVIIGSGLGAIFYGHIPTSYYFLLDSISFGLGALGCIWGCRLDPSLNTTLGFTSKSQKMGISWHQFSDHQKKAALLLPILALGGTPAVALLPSIALTYGAKLECFGFSFFSIPAFLFMKSLGQMLGPLALSSAQIEKVFDSPRGILVPLLGFALLYILVTSHLFKVEAALFLILGAHFLSNIIFAVGTSALPKFFKGQQAAELSATQYQIQIIVMTMHALIVSRIALHLPTTVILGLNAILTLCISYWLMSADRAQPTRKVPSPTHQASSST